VAIFVIIAGIGVFSFTTSLIVTSFTEKLDEIKSLKVIDDIAKIKEFYLVCGYESVAKEVVRELSLKHKVIILEEDETKVKLAKENGFIALKYNPGSIESYTKLRIDIKTQVKAIICLGKSDVDNVYTALTVRSFNKDVFILSILKNKANKNKLTFAGVNEIVYEKELIGVTAKEFVGQHVAFEVIHALRSSYTNIDVDEIVVDERILENYTSVGVLNTLRYRIILLGVYKKSKKSFIFNPEASITLERGDYLLVIGDSQFLREFNTYLHMKVSS
ncbi:MAG: NAD-binding protein, partial [Sulfurimonas sp.]|nr:NAD-binding protein [Sulfurimonas sp.]